MVDAAQNFKETVLSSPGPITAECPECGKHCIVETGPYKYQCLSCNFSRDFTQMSQQTEAEDSQGTNGPGLLLTIFIAVLVTIALL